MIFKKKDDIQTLVCCEECGVALQIEKAQKVKVNYPLDPATFSKTFFYCQAHKKLYDEKDEFYSIKKSIYYKTIQVDENGKEIKTKV